MAGLVPKEAQYGDQTALRRAGLKSSPITGTPTMFKPQGGRPPKTGAQPVAPALGGEPQATPPADLPAEHQDQGPYQRAMDLAAAARVWMQLAEGPLATPKVKRTAAALHEAARMALLDTREKTPWVKGM